MTFISSAIKYLRKLFVFIFIKSTFSNINKKFLKLKMSNIDWDGQNRQLVAEGRNVLERTSASIARSNQIAIETEQVGTEV